MIVQPLALFAQLQKLLGLLAVPLERADPPLQLAENVAQTLEVALGGGQTALGLIFAVAVFGDAGRSSKISRRSADLAPTISAMRPCPTMA